VVVGVPEGAERVKEVVWERSGCGRVVQLEKGSRARIE